MNFTLLIPCYNFEPRLPELFKKIEAWHASRAQGCQVFFVDDGSSDKTAELLEEFQRAHSSWCHLKKMLANGGKGAAIQAGFLEAAKFSEFVVFTDCDLHYGLDVIHDRVLPALESNDVVILDRSWRVNAQHRPFRRKITSFIFNRLVAVIAGISYRDTQAGLKGFRVATCLPLFEMMTIHSFAFDVELLSVASFYRLRIHRVPVYFQNEPAGGAGPSSVGILGSSLSMTLGLMKIYWNWKTGQYMSERLKAAVDSDLYRLDSIDRK